MFIMGLLTAVYLFVATAAALMTYDEQKRTHSDSFTFRMLGYLACLFWPVTLMTVAVAAQRKPA